MTESKVTDATVSSIYDSMSEAWNMVVTPEQRRYLIRTDLEAALPLLSQPVSDGEPDYWAVHSSTGVHIGLWSSKTLAQNAMREYPGSVITALYALSQSPPSGERGDHTALAVAAFTAVKALDDWTANNEAEFTGWGDGDVPPTAAFWRAKSGQALRAIQELLPKVKP